MRRSGTLVLRRFRSELCCKLVGGEERRRAVFDQGVVYLEGFWEEGTYAVVQATETIVTQDMCEGCKHPFWSICGAGLKPDLGSL